MQAGGGGDLPPAVSLIGRRLDGGNGLSMSAYAFERTAFGVKLRPAG